MRPPRSSERPAVEIGGGGVGGLTANAGTARKEGRPISIFRVGAHRPRRRQPSRRTTTPPCEARPRHRTGHPLHADRRRMGKVEPGLSANYAGFQSATFTIFKVLNIREL